MNRTRSPFSAHIFGAVIGLVLPLVLTGCAGRTAIPVEDLAAAPARDEYFVTTTAGEELDFVSLSVSEGSLKGTVRTIQKRVTGQGDNERMEVRNQYREAAIPLSEVRSVEVRKGGPDASVILAVAGAAVAAGVYAILSSGNDDGSGNGDGTGGGREPPPLPAPGRPR